MRYLIVYEKSPTGWGAYAPDLPGLGAAGTPSTRSKISSAKPLNFISKACASAVTPSQRRALKLSTSRSDDCPVLLPSQPANRGG